MKKSSPQQEISRQLIYVCWCLQISQLISLRIVWSEGCLLVSLRKKPLHVECVSGCSQVSSGTVTIVKDDLLPDTWRCDPRARRDGYDDWMDGAMNDSELVVVLAALGHTVRLSLWRILLPHGAKGLPAGAIADRMAIIPSSLSFHLR